MAVTYDGKRRAAGVHIYIDGQPVPVKILFDDKGRPPPNAPLEDIVEERRRLEYHVMWFEGLLAELKNRLVRTREVEEYAFEMLSQATNKE